MSVRALIVCICVCTGVCVCVFVSIMNRDKGIGAPVEWFSLCFLSIVPLSHLASLELAKLALLPYSFLALPFLPLLH